MMWRECFLFFFHIICVSDRIRGDGLRGRSPHRKSLVAQIKVRFSLRLGLVWWFG